MVYTLKYASKMRLRNKFIDGVLLICKQCLHINSISGFLNEIKESDYSILVHTESSVVVLARPHLCLPLDSPLMLTTSLLKHGAQSCTQYSNCSLISVA